jgi:hypothetical protein
VRGRLLVLVSFVFVALVVPATATAATTARYVYSPSSPVVGTPVKFDASTSTCDRTPCTYAWTDDGPDGPGGTNWSLGAGQTVSITFASAGTKYIRLSVRNSFGERSSTVKAIVVASQPAPAPTPVAGTSALYSYSPSSPTAGQAVTFDASASSCGRTPCKYTWSDDGPDGPGGTNWSLGTGVTATFTFSTASTKYVRLTVEDASGERASTVKAVVVAAATAPAPTPSPTPTPVPSVEVDTVTELQQAVAAAPNGSAIYVAGGSYGAVAVTAARNGYVTIRPTAGATVTLADVNFGPSASYVRLEGFTVSSQVDIAENGGHHVQLVGNDLRGVKAKWGSHDLLIERNWIHDCGNCISLISTAKGVPGSPDPNANDLAPVSNVTIRGNKIARPATDALFLSNFRSVLVEGNDISGVIENGAHNDCLQTVWGGDGLTFRENYLHDNRCQGFFIKDGEVKNVVVENNLMIRNNMPASGQGQPHVFQVYGVRTMRVERNTMWPSAGSQVLRDDASSGILVQNNIMSNFVPSDDSGTDTTDFYRDRAVLVEDYNVLGGSSAWASTYKGAHSVRSSSPAFRSPSTDDFRLSGPLTGGGETYAAGVDWRPADRHYGP